jgi:hypothetical protein
MLYVISLRYLVRRMPVNGNMVGMEVKQGMCSILDICAGD